MLNIGCRYHQAHSFSFLCEITTSQANEYVSSLETKPGRSLESLYPVADPAAIGLLKKMLMFNPSKRCTAAEALNHEFLKPVRRKEMEVSARIWTFILFATILLITVYPRILSMLELRHPTSGKPKVSGDKSHRCCKIERRNIQGGVVVFSVITNAI